MSIDQNKPNHFFHDSLGDPETCEGDHNHPGSEVDPEETAARD